MATLHRAPGMVSGKKRIYKLPILAKDWPKIIYDTEWWVDHVGVLFVYELSGGFSSITFSLSAVTQNSVT